MKKAVLLILVLASYAACAFPSAASAGAWDIEPTPGGFPLGFTLKGGGGSLTTATTTISCTSVSGTGSYENATTGKIQVTFHGCKGPLGVTCTSSGAPAGTIVTTNLPFHNVLLEASPRKPGVLLTPATVDNVPAAGEGHFATFVCFGITTIIRGNGVLGEYFIPDCAGFGVIHGGLIFASATAGIQEWTRVTTSGTSYGLTSRTGSEHWRLLSTHIGGTVTFDRESKFNCT
jgi:hypothetical protein